jgi:hypothetical protein
LSSSQNRRRATAEARASQPFHNLQ